MTLTQEIEAMARDVAESLGREWSDCGEYERESFRDEARRQMGQWMLPQDVKDKAEQEG